MRTSVSPRATRLCASHRASQNGKCGGNAKHKMVSVLRSYFAGGRIRKTKTKRFLKFGGIRISAPQEGAGGMRGGFLLWRGDCLESYIFIFYVKFPGVFNR